MQFPAFPFVSTDKIPLRAFPSSDQTTPALSALPYTQYTSPLSWPCLWLIPVRTFLLYTGSPAAEKAPQIRLISVEWREKITSSTAVSSLPNAAQDASCHLCHEGTLLAHIQLGVHQDTQGPPLHSCFSTGQLSACSGAWGCSFPRTGLCTSTCWAARGSCWPISSACPGPSGYQHNPLAYQPLFPSLSCLGFVYAASDEGYRLMLKYLCKKTEYSFSFFSPMTWFHISSQNCTWSLQMCLHKLHFCMTNSIAQRPEIQQPISHIQAEEGRILQRQLYASYPVIPSFFYFICLVN